MKLKCVICETELRKDKVTIDAQWCVFAGTKWLCRDCIKEIAQQVIEEF